MEDKYRYTLDSFLQLNRKTQELIFDNLMDKNSTSFFAYYRIGDMAISLSPIEQIFYISNYINDFYGKQPFMLQPQKEIIVDGKKYIVDFYIDNALYLEEDIRQEYLLCRPLIIELDGIEYHGKKHQMNHDYERETNLKLAGYELIRFTGSQVYNDVYGCLEKVRKLLDNIPKRLVKEQ